MNHTELLALSGSLRKTSYNTAAIKTLQNLSPNNIDITIFSGLANLPLFNPDIEEKNIPALNDLQIALAESQGLIIASPEYAHGISGVLKNTSPRATHAQAALREVLKTMSGIIIEEACVSIPLLDSELTAHGDINNIDISESLKSSLNTFCKAIKKTTQSNNA